MKREVPSESHVISNRTSEEPGGVDSQKQHKIHEALRGKGSHTASVLWGNKPSKEKSRAHPAVAKKGPVLQKVTASTESVWCLRTQTTLAVGDALSENTTRTRIAVLSSLPVKSKSFEESKQVIVAT